MRNLNILFSLTFVCGLSACSSSPKNDGNTIDLSRIGQEEILQKYGKDDSLKSADPFVVSGGLVKATSLVTIPGDHRPEAGVKMAQAQAVSTLATTVERRIESALQIASETTSADAVQMRDLIAQSSSLVANDFRPGHVYYERVRVIGDNGVPRTEYRIWAEMSSDEASFKRHIIDAMRKQEGKATLSSQMTKAVDSQWAKITGTDNRNPAKQQDEE